MVKPFRRIRLGRRYITVDAADYASVKEHSWSALVSSNGKVTYAATSIRRGSRKMSVLMHRLITKAPPHVEIDHIDGNGLNNRRSNFRKANRSQNSSNRTRLSAANKTGHTGVRYCKRWRKWVVDICKDRVLHRLGGHNELKHALAVRRAAEVMLFGEYAPKCKHKYTSLVGKYDTIADLKAATASPYSDGRRGGL